MKALTTILIMLFALQLNAQHMTFEGISMDCAPKDFANSLKKKGYHKGHAYDGSIGMQGPYECYNNTKLLILDNSLGQTDGVLVTCKTSSQWNTLISEYEKLKKILSDKYGEPVEFETIKLSEEPDKDKIKKIKSGETDIHCDFNIGDTGRITLSVAEDIYEYAPCSVQIYFCDMINSRFVLLDL